MAGSTQQIAGTVSSTAHPTSTVGTTPAVTTAYAPVQVTTPAVIPPAVSAPQSASTSGWGAWPLNFEEFTPITQVKKFVSPVAKKLDKGTKTTTLSTASHAKQQAIDEDYLLIAVILQVARGGARGLRLHDVAKSFSVSHSYLKELVERDCWGLLTISDQNFVTLKVDKFLICYKYNVGKCRNTYDCQRLHLCARWLFGKCTRCVFEHEFLDDHNLSKLADMGIDDWEPDKLKLLIVGLENQLPAVCDDYNDQGCRFGASCDYFHVCAEFVEGRCSFGRNCQLSHRLHHFENKRRIQEIYSFKWFDKFDQLRARLGLGLTNLPKLNDVLLTQKISKSGKISNAQQRNWREHHQSTLV